MPAYNPRTDDHWIEVVEELNQHGWYDEEQTNQAYEEYIMDMPGSEVFKHFNGISDKDACDVSNPSHYTVGGYEAIDVIKAKLTPEEYRGYCKGNVLKYIMRANYKGHHDKDCQKADYYMCELLDGIPE